MLSTLTFQGETTSKATSITLRLKTGDNINIQNISLYCGSSYIIDSETQAVTGTLKENGVTLSTVEIKSEGYYTFSINKEYEANKAITLTFSFDHNISYSYSKVTDILGSSGLFLTKNYNVPTCIITIQNDLELYWQIEDLMNEGLPYINSIDIYPIYSNLQSWVDSGELFSLFHQYWLSQWDWYDYYTNYVYKIDSNKWDGYPYVWIPPEIEEVIIEGLMVYTGEADNKFQQRLVFVDKVQQALYMNESEV